MAGGKSHYLASLLPRSGDKNKTILCSYVSQYMGIVLSDLGLNVILVINICGW